jgi:methyltransferase (TIGR00027 family)
METGKPSRTAMGVALHRAAHQTLEGASIFRDPFARAILGPGADDALAAATLQKSGMRLFVAVRARFAEDSLAMAVERGVAQAVILGAGLDTFALRNPWPQLRVFEVDHPDTQTWKRQCLARADLALPANACFVPIDFESGKLSDGLAAAGFAARQPAFFVWLGVVPYLTADAISVTLDFIAGMPQGEVAFDYFEPMENYAPQARARAEVRAARAAALGEPWLSHFTPQDMAALLKAKGFNDIEDLGPAEIGARFPNVPVQKLRSGWHVLRARRDQ